MMDPVPSGNLPPGFDSSSCRSSSLLMISSLEQAYLFVGYVGNIHFNVTESLLAEAFQSAGPLEGCKLIRKEKSSIAFVDYHDRRSAALAIMTLHGRQLYGQAIKVNWAYASGQREDTSAFIASLCSSAHFNVFVGDLSPEVTDATLFACFSVYPSCSDARVMWDHKTGRSRGFGFVSFRNQQDAQSAINDLTGKWLGNRQIRCNWAAKGAGFNEEKQNNDNQIAVVLTNGSSDGGQEYTNEEAPENNPAYTTVYVGNLAHEVTQAELHRQFHALGAGVLEEVRVQRDKGFGFVRYHTHEEAALAIQMANGRMVCGKSMKMDLLVDNSDYTGFDLCFLLPSNTSAVEGNANLQEQCSWGSKPTPPGTASNPLPPPYQILPTPGINQGYAAADLLAYQRQLALNQAAGSGLSGQALLQMAGQHGLAAPQASRGSNSVGSQGMYDGYPNNSSGQHYMYYQ
ncbi:hypothetical protein HHK36_006491 [Tetracentron sinense]|uniref:RRM domain-containing protein n=1 Tax=Tetracentron sinense TaxID=13715 RepID=A0A834ZLN3_TETSI|nr:hypothetical protein HHK36_006491 [Tetracentron sinense]